MKKLLFSIGEPISGLGGLTGIVPQTAKIEDDLLLKKQFSKDLTSKDISKAIQFSQNVFKGKENIIDSISNSIIERKTSVNKTIKETITFDDFYEITNSIIDGYRANNFINQLQAEEARKLINKQAYKSFVSDFSKDINSYKKEFTKIVATNKPKKQDEEFKITRTVLESDKGYVVNLVNNEVNSKELTVQFFKLENELKNINIIYKGINDNIVNLNYRIKVAIGLKIAASATSIVTAFLGFFSLGLAFFLSAGAGVASIGLSIHIKNLKRQKEAYVKNLDSIKLLIKPGKKYDSGFMDAYGFSKDVITSVPVNVFSTVWNYSKGQKFWYSGLKEGLKNLRKGFFWQIPGIALDIADITISVNEIIGLNNESSRINSYLQNLENWLNLISQNLENIKKVEWVVVKETPQTAPYNKGGIGGRNEVFKNLKTGEILTIDEMLKQPDWKLYSWGLKKVFNPRLNVWYIRKLPNHTKKDNLG
ncbi:hypothetical protein BCF59_0468 [Mycoplasmopsis mustelae]|uniref:Uncharacterized protein n=1 Tax=Mycoplasmopsis mustelae TaxID=171289 RepID=A0A4R7UFW7_9BACT|nr:hypothetical protein [Mycoplasmopsis mustelae]TDV24495.1 hypothetical protein BCF59_0468 [Mycoplasmopsis mustelae]